MSFIIQQHKQLTFPLFMTRMESLKKIHLFSMESRFRNQFSSSQALSEFIFLK